MLAFGVHKAWYPSFPSFIYLTPGVGMGMSTYIYIYIYIYRWRLLHTCRDMRLHAHSRGVVNDWRPTWTKAMCCSLCLAPRWHGVVTLISLSFRFIPCLPLGSVERLWLRSAGLGFHFFEPACFVAVVRWLRSVIITPLWNNETAITAVALETINYNFL